MTDDSSRSAVERLERIAASQSMLAEVSRSLGPALDLDTTVKGVLAAMRQLVDFRGGSICLVDGGDVRIAAADPPASDDVMALRLPVGSGIAGRVVVTGETIYVPDLDADIRVDAAVRRVGSNAGMTSYLGVPLVCLGKAIGLLQVDSPTVDAFDEVDIMLLEGLATQTANAIEGARMLEEMARIDGLKRGFISLVSHELRTPLTIADGMVRTYRELRGPEVDPDLEHLLDRGAQAIRRLQRLIEELIMMSQLAAGELVSATEPVSIRELVDEVVEASHDPGAISVDIDGDIEIVTDRRLLARVLDALVENAVLYAGHAEVTAHDRVIEITDHGPGIPADVVDAAGATFARAVGNNTTIAGLGLGLPMARALVGELDGELEVRSSAEHGTTVAISLP